jgi:hypothetical protein
MGFSRTKLPFFVLAIGLTGCVIALVMQYYTNAVDWTRFSGVCVLHQWQAARDFACQHSRHLRSDRILSSAFATFFGMWIFNKLPRFANPLHRIARFKRATNDPLSS